MRADNDHAIGNSVESFKDESTKPPHQCSEEKWEDAELKISENGKSNNNSNVCELFYDTRSGDKWDKENDGNTLERRSNEAAKIVRDDDFTLDKVDPVVYMDKNVTACDLPEIVVCYKESNYHVVKDICVDEGVPVQEKFLFGEKGSVKSSSEDPFETKASEEEEEGNSKKVDDSELCSDRKTDRVVEESFAVAEGSSNVNQEHLIVTEEVKDSKDEVAITSEDILKGFLTLGDILSREEDEQKPLNNEEQSQPQLQDKTEETEEKLSSVSSTTTSQELKKTCNDAEKRETENQQKNYLVGDDNLSSSRFGETSFSAAEAVSISGHITYSGPVTFSGSLSVRSDASTTSGRSFAFPILQSEWNSSPVRMAKADKRRQKGWRHSFLCCRFS